MRTASSHLSPLNFRGLLHQQGLVVNSRDAQQAKPPSERVRCVTCYECTECGDLHKWEDDAEECCKPAAPEPSADGRAQACRVCGEHTYSFRDATDCCLWKDLIAPARHAAADAVEAGATWAEALAPWMQAAQP